MCTGIGYELVQYEAQQGAWWCAVIIPDSVCGANRAACPQHPNLAHTDDNRPVLAPSESAFEALAPLALACSHDVCSHSRARGATCSLLCPCLRARLTRRLQTCIRTLPAGRLRGRITYSSLPAEFYKH